VTVDFVGATSIKRRSAIVESSATTPTDYILQDWAAAGLRRPSVFRAYFGTAQPSAVRVIGRLSERDWQGVQACLARAISIP
jgi:mRNA interferase MazF